MEKDWKIAELTEMFRDEMESMGLLEPEHPDDLFVVDDEETEPAPFKTINYLLDSKKLYRNSSLKNLESSLQTISFLLLNSSSSICMNTKDP